MATFKIENINIVGISACVPKNIIANRDSKLFNKSEELDAYINSTGVEFRRIVDKDICSSDLCFEAAERLLSELKWDKKDIDVCFFVSQTPDYIYPATSCILQNRLGLSENCMCLDISCGCPGYVYGMSSISAIMSASKMKKGLLLVGETVSKTRSPFDKVNLISGDAGTCTALEFNDNCNNTMLFDLYVDGGGWDSIVIPGGGFRNMITKESLEYKVDDDGIKRTKLHTKMDGAGVFAFAISRVPKSINNLFEKYSLKKEDIDYFIFHQANLFINRKIQKKLSLDDSKVPMNLKNFGNTSSTSIPLNIVCNLQNKLDNKRVLACGFGVGLSWGNVVFDAKRIKILDLIEL